jgi:hypothetical protein
MTPTTQKAHLEFRGATREAVPLKKQTTPHAYREGTRTKALKRTFLGGGFVPAGLHEDGSAITAVAPPMAGEHNGTCVILNG